MKSNIVKILLLIFTLTLSLSVFSACGGHTHDYSISNFDNENHWYECSCGEKAYVEAHSGGSATCAKKATCKVCNNAYGETIAHNYKSVVTPPTCTEKGYTTYTCSCGDVYKDSYVDALGHDYKEIVIDPTCTQMGYTQYVCDCGDSYVDENSYVDAKYHDYSDWTASPDGAIYKVCSRDDTHKLYKKAENELAVLYSAHERRLDFTTLKRALNEQGVDIYSNNDIEGYIVNGERVERLELKVNISNVEGGFVDNYGRDRTVAIPQTVTVIVRGQEYLLDTVYAYSKIIDEAKDLKYFTMTGTRRRNELDGYYIVTKNIDASQLELDAHVFESVNVYPGNGYNADVGFRGVLDGQGYTIDGLTLKSCGLFGNANAPIIKNIAFTNVNLTGYYPTLFAMTFSRGKNPDNSFNGYEGLLKNVYVSVNSTEKGSASRVGLLVNNVLPAATKLENVVVEYLNVSKDIQTHIDGGKNFYMFGSSTYSMAGSVETYSNCFAISTAPILQHSRNDKPMPGFAENQVEFTLGKAQYGYKVDSVGTILDNQVKTILEKYNIHLSVDHVLVGVRAYDNYQEMANANNDYSSFSTDYWSIENGVPVWKTI